VTPPDFLAIGHICKDLIRGGYAVGGTASYGSLAAQRLGRRVGVVTSLGAGLDPRLFLPEVEMAIFDSPVTTTFHNTYRQGQRQQYVLKVAPQIEAGSVPEGWLGAEIVLLGPVAGEVGEDMADLFPDSLVGLSAQGLLRTWDGEGRVHFSPPQGIERLLSKVDVVFLSEEDVEGDEALAQAHARLAPLGVITGGERGGTLFEGSEGWDFPACESRALDPTGAGDVFAAAFLVRLSEMGDPRRAARFASCAAALAIEGPGLLGIPNRVQLEARLAMGRYRLR
jgi:sugar/nucleoside kinase (ribokinase family)